MSSAEFNETMCLACDGSYFKDWGMQASAIGTYRWKICVRCKSGLALPRPTTRELKNFYEDHYSAPGVTIPDVVEKSLRSTVQSFDRYKSASGTLIDVGFGEGTLLRIARDMGWQCAGTEYSRSAIEWGKGENIAVHEGDFGEGILTGPFDVATVVETVEHVVNPRGLLEAVYSRLRPGGLLYGTTPNLGGLSARILKSQWSVVAAPEHLQLFSTGGIRTLLRGVGFRNIRVSTRSLNIAEIKHGVMSRGSSEFDRVHSAYALNESLESRRLGRLGKRSANHVLQWIGGGDTIVFRASRAIGSV